ncbi:fructose-bisphosphatase class II [Cloacibacillus evryensis]|uniref:fructose-bisphosphatase class II n=1 Tax=Cloacibacillus evryensis TaxID=508460 RepID=UPI003CCBC189
MTGATVSDWLKGVRYSGEGIETSSLVMRAKSGTLRYINAAHNVQKLDEISAASNTALRRQPARSCKRNIGLRTITYMLPERGINAFRQHYYAITLNPCPLTTSRFYP